MSYPGFRAGSCLRMVQETEFKCRLVLRSVISIVSRISYGKLCKIVYKTELLITVAAPTRNHRVLNCFNTAIADSNPDEDMNLGLVRTFVF
jgi:hypothetical protein